VRQSKWSMRISWRRGPSHCFTRSGSTWARNTLATGASTGHDAHVGNVGIDGDLGFVRGGGHGAVSFLGDLVDDFARDVADVFGGEMALDLGDERCPRFVVGAGSSGMARSASARRRYRSSAWRR